MQTIVVGVIEINQRILENSFRSFNYPEPTFVDDTTSALEKIDEERFSLAIANKQLPEMMAVDFVAKLRNHEDYQYTPVLLIGEQFTQKEIIQAIQTGVNQVLLMPLTTPDLEEKVKAAHRMGR